jgi:hypothetical protein
VTEHLARRVDLGEHASRAPLVWTSVVGLVARNLDHPVNPAQNQAVMVG